MARSAFEETIANRFRLDRAPTLLAQHSAISPISFTRLRNEGQFRGRTLAAPPEEAFSFHVTLAPMSSGEIWISGKHGKLEAARPGGIFVFDLTASKTANLAPPYDLLRFYLPTATLDELAYDRGVQRVGGLRTTQIGSRDPVMHGLALSLLPALQEPAHATTLFLDSIALAFHAHVLHAYGGVLGNSGKVLSGLAPWQLRRAYAFIEAHLDGDPSIADVAQECRLSASHFSRAFRRTIGMPPHRWLIKRRVERAKELLRKDDQDLVQIALACGFVDQSHMIRTFARHEGQTPAKWRRLRCNPMTETL